MTAANGMWDKAERAQVYARDRRLDDDAALVYLVRGAADEHRQDARDGRLVCPLPNCDQPELIVRAGSRRDHFAHRVSPTADHTPERLMHLQGKALIAEWLRGLFDGALVVCEEVPIGDGNRIADVLARSPRGGRMAFEIQYAGLTIEEWQARHADYAAHGIRDIWLWGHIAPHCRRPQGEHADRERTITPTMLAYARETGRPILWINPEEQMLAVGATREDLDLSEDLPLTGAKNTTELSWAFYDSRSALAWAASMDQWRLEADGPTSQPAQLVRTLREHKQARKLAAQHAREHVAAQRERREAERAARAAWRAKHADELAERRERHARRDQDRWEREAPAVLARVGGQLPAVITQPLNADRRVFMASEHWHALVYEAHLHHMQPGEGFTYRDVCRTVFSALAEAGIWVRDSQQIYPAITALLFHLRRHGWLAFEASPGSWYIDGPIRMWDQHPAYPDALRSR